MKHDRIPFSTHKRKTKDNVIYVVPVHKTMEQGMIGNDQYAIPLIEEGTRYIPIEKFRMPIQKLVEYANKQQNKKFIVPRLGCNALQYDDYDIAPFFGNAPMNMVLYSGWRSVYLDVANKNY